jgi:hypothetical protein
MTLRRTPGVCARIAASKPLGLADASSMPLSFPFVLRGEP